MLKIWNAAKEDAKEERCVLCLGDCEAVVLALAVASKETARAFFRCEMCRAVMSCTPRLLACPVCNKRV